MTRTKPAVDHITVTGIAATGIHGVYDSEKLAEQDFILDLVLWFDMSVAADSDELADTINYVEAAEVARQVVATQSCDLIETLAARVCQRLLADTIAETVQVTIHKPLAARAAGAADVCVTVTRSRS